jgi:hypothetical protein
MVWKACPTCKKLADCYCFLPLIIVVKAHHGFVCLCSSSGFPGRRTNENTTGFTHRDVTLWSMQGIIWCRQLKNCVLADLLCTKLVMLYLGFEAIKEVCTRLEARTSQNANCQAAVNKAKAIFGPMSGIKDKSFLNLSKASQLDKLGADIGSPSSASSVSLALTTEKRKRTPSSRTSGGGSPLALKIMSVRRKAIGASAGGHSGGRGRGRGTRHASGTSAGRILAIPPNDGSTTALRASLPPSTPSLAKQDALVPPAPVSSTPAANITTVASGAVVQTQLPLVPNNPGALVPTTFSVSDIERLVSAAASNAMNLTMKDMNAAQATWVARTTAFNSRFLMESSKRSLDATKETGDFVAVIAKQAKLDVESVAEQAKRDLEGISKQATQDWRQALKEEMHMLSDIVADRVADRLVANPTFITGVATKLNELLAVEKERQLLLLEQRSSVQPAHAPSVPAAIPGSAAYGVPMSHWPHYVGAGGGNGGGGAAGVFPQQWPHHNIMPPTHSQLPAVHLHPYIAAATAGATPGYPAVPGRTTATGYPGAPGNF